MGEFRSNPAGERTADRRFYGIRQRRINATCRIKVPERGPMRAVEDQNVLYPNRKVC